MSRFKTRYTTYGRYLNQTRQSRRLLIVLTDSFFIIVLIALLTLAVGAQYSAMGQLTSFLITTGLLLLAYAVFHHQALRLARRLDT